MTASPSGRHHRVLVLSSASFNRVHGAAITLSNLFSGWPREQLAMVHCDAVPASAELCDAYYLLGGDEIRRLGPFLGMRPLSGGDAGAEDGPGRAARAAKRVVFGNMLPDSGRLTAGLEQWIDEFRPTVLYTTLGSNAMMDLTRAICDRFSTKLVVHFMDDWQAIAYRGGLLSVFARRRMERLVRETVERADLRMGISPAMCDAYEQRFGRAFVPFMNAIDPTRYAGPAPAKNVGEILYVGSILPNAQLHALRDVCSAVSLLRDRGARLTILTSAPYLRRYRDVLAIAPNIVVAESPPDGPEFMRLLQSASVLVLPVNFDRESVDFIRYSLPTKVPAYLASGTPVLAYGPREVAQIAYANAAAWAYVVDAESVPMLRDGLDHLLNDAPIRRRLSTRAAMLAELQHSLPRVQREFQDEIEGLS